jgi:hypothetical protein
MRGRAPCGGGEVLGATRLGVLLRSMSLGADGVREVGSGQWGRPPVA